MKTFKTNIFLALATTLIGASAFANTVQAICSVTDSRFIETTKQHEIIVQNLLGQEAIASFSNAPKQDETIITDNDVVMAFSNGVDNYYSFALVRADVDEAILNGQSQAYAEVRFTNENTKHYEKYLRDGQMLQMYADCQLVVVR